MIVRVALASMIAVVTAATVNTDPPSASRRLVQFNASIFEWAGSPGAANWGRLPFGAPGNATFGAPLAEALYEKTTDAFVLRIDDALWSVTGGAETPSFSRVTTLPDSACALALKPSGVCFTNSSCAVSTVVAVCAAGVVEVAMTPGVPAVVSKWVFRSALCRRPVSAAVVASLAQGTVAIATPGGAYTWSVGDDPRPIRLTNTTGGRVEALNVTLVFCIPRDAPTGRNAFLGSECFATSRSPYCGSNLCPADLLHLLDTAATRSSAALQETSHRFIRVPGVIDAAPTGAVFVADDADGNGPQVVIANDVATAQLFRNGTLQRSKGIEGKRLPQHFLTTAAAGPPRLDGNHAPDVWFGSGKGVVLRRGDGPDRWKYLYGPRWLPGKGFDAGMTCWALAVNASDGSALVVTDGGLSLIRRLNSFTLADKATGFAEPFYATQVFNSYGLSVAHQPLRRWGDIYSSSRDYSDNSGCWTSIYLASQCFRYATTGDADARANAWRAFEGMELLVRVTGVRGLMARAALNQSNPPPHGKHDKWYRSTAMPGWVFWAQASSDEVTGHLHVYPLMHDLVAETPQEKARVAALIDAITGHFVDHGLRLIDVDGLPTEWGRWDPATLNDNPEWYDERGIGSLEILSYLSSAYRITKNATYAAAFDDLVANHSYADNLLNAKIMQPGDRDPSDDMLSFFAYLCMVWSSRPSRAMPDGNPLFASIAAQLQASVQRSWRAGSRRSRIPLWGVIYLQYFRTSGNNASSATGGVPTYETVVGGDAAAIEDDAAFYLGSYPLTLVDWPVNNSARLDIRWSPYVNRNGKPRSLLLAPLLPYDEISSLEWNGSPFDPAAGSGMRLHNPSTWLYPFWAARYFGVLRK